MREEFKIRFSLAQTRPRFLRTTDSMYDFFYYVRIPSDTVKLKLANSSSLLSWWTLYRMLALSHNLPNAVIAALQLMVSLAVKIPLPSCFTYTEKNLCCRTSFLLS